MLDCWSRPAIIEPDQVPIVAKDFPRFTTPSQLSFDARLLVPAPAGAKDHTLLRILHLIYDTHYMISYAQVYNHIARGEHAHILIQLDA